MTVKELITSLERCSEDAKVVLSLDEEFREITALYSDPAQSFVDRYGDAEFGPIVVLNHWPFSDAALEEDTNVEAEEG